MATSVVDKLVEEKPLFHRDLEGGETCYHSNTNLLRVLEKIVQPDTRTLEVGAGYSTVVFLGRGCLHTCITPVQEEVDRIADFCRKGGVPLDRANFIVSPSDQALPSLPAIPFDLVFIDGAHRFPNPIVDWYFGALLLKKDGLIVIDDTDLVSIYVLLRFMSTDHHWKEEEIKENYAIFRKVGNLEYPGDWPAQPFSRNKIRKRKDILKAFFPRKRTE